MLPTKDLQYVVAGFIGYQTLIALARGITFLSNRTFYEQLKNDTKWKFRAYFVFPVGFMITLATVPICIEAYASTSAESDTTVTMPAMSLAGKICVGSRGVLWISELPLLSYSSAYINHHILSLSSLALILLNDLPRRPLYLIYAGLVTELFSDTVAVLKFHGFNSSNSRIYAGAATASALSLVILRAVPALAITTSALMLPSTRAEQAYVAAVIFYCGWLLRLSYMQLKQIGLVRIVLNRPAHFVIGNQSRISIFRILLGLSMTMTQASSAIFYYSNKSEVVSAPEIYFLSITGLGTVFAGLFGAKIINSLMTLPLKQSNPPSQRRKGDEGQNSEHLVVSKALPSWMLSITERYVDPLIGQDYSLNGISIQGGVLFAASWLAFGPTAASPVNRSLLVASTLLSLPLGEALGRVGCFFGGCCGSMRDENGEPLYPPVQFLTSLMNLSLFLSLINAFNAGVFDVYKAAAIASAGNAAIRLVVDPLRNDTNGNHMNITSFFAGGQLLLSSLFIIENKAGQDVIPVSIATVAVCLTLFCCARVARTAYILLMRFVWRSQMKWLIRPVNLVYTFSGIVVALILSDTYNRDTETTFRSTVSNDVWLFLKSPAFLSCAAVTVLLPLLA
jgi:hypothetical protein